jgi:hypothetical protein
LRAEFTTNNSFALALDDFPSSDLQRLPASSYGFSLRFGQATGALDLDGRLFQDVDVAVPHLNEGAKRSFVFFLLSPSQHRVKLGPNRAR